MANPTIVACTADTWVKVATAVKTGAIHRMTQKSATYLQTYRLTGGVAPTTIDEGIDLFPFANTATIGNTVDIDVYVYCIGVTGSVRVDV